MAITDGEVKVRVNFEGGGNVGVVADKASKAVGNVDKAAKGLDKSMASTVKRFGELGPVSVEGADRARGEFDKLAGVLGIVGGLAVGIYEGFKALTAMSMASTIAEMRELANQAGRVAQGYREAAKASSGLQNIQRTAQMEGLQTQLSIATSKGDKQVIKDLTAQIKALKGSWDAGDRRQQAKEIREQANDARRNQAQGAGGLAASLGKLGLYTQRLEELNRLNPFQMPMPKGMAVLQERDRLKGLIAAESASLPTMNLAAQGTAIMEGGEEIARALEATADLIDLERLLPAPGGGGGGKTPTTPRVDLGDSPQFGTDFDWDRLLDDLENFEEANNDAVYGAAGAWHEFYRQLEDIQELEPLQAMAEGFTGFADALGYAADAIAEFSPELAAFSQAAAEIKELWSDFGNEQFKVANAVTLSVGAILKAGAAQIKGERERAGVMALIEIGLGIATSFTNPPEAATHFAAAAVLGLAAAGVGGSSGGGARTERVRPRVLNSGEAGGGPSNWTTIINAPFLASSQETVHALRDMMAEAG